MTSADSLFYNTNKVTNDSVKNQRLASYENSIPWRFLKNQSIEIQNKFNFQINMHILLISSVIDGGIKESINLSKIKEK